MWEYFGAVARHVSAKLVIANKPWHVVIATITAAYRGVEDGYAIRGTGSPDFRPQNPCLSRQAQFTPRSRHVLVVPICYTGSPLKHSCQSGGQASAGCGQADVLVLHGAARILISSSRKSRCQHGLSPSLPAFLGLRRRPLDAHGIIGRAMDPLITDIQEIWCPPRILVYLRQNERSWSRGDDRPRSAHSGSCI